MMFHITDVYPGAGPRTPREHASPSGWGLAESTCCSHTRDITVQDNDDKRKRGWSRLEEAPPSFVIGAAYALATTRPSVCAAVVGRAG